MPPTIANYGPSIFITCYFLLNLFVTYTNKQILGESSQGTIQQPYLLTASHGVTSFVGCVALKWFLKHVAQDPNTLRPETKRQTHSISTHQYMCLVIFSLFYTINIALSNLSMALIDLALNQTIRATAPLLTVSVSVLFLRHPLHTYSTSTCLSLLPIVSGVIVAVSSPETISRHSVSNDIAIQPEAGVHSGHRTIGVLITLLGALTAVLKTILTHRLMTSLSLNLSALQLLQILSPYAAIQAFGFAYFAGEYHIHRSQLPPDKLPSIKLNQLAQRIHKNLTITSPAFIGKRGSWRTPASILWMTNAVAAFLLNIASFEANKRNGPVSMAVAANLKQVAILIIPLMSPRFGKIILEDGKIKKNIVIGTALTVAGGIWYAWSTARDKNKQAMLRALAKARNNSDQDWPAKH